MGVMGDMEATEVDMAEDLEEVMVVDMGVMAADMEDTEDVDLVADMEVMVVMVVNCPKGCQDIAKLPSPDISVNYSVEIILKKPACVVQL